MQYEKNNMINYYVNSKRTRDIRIPRDFRELYSFFITKNLRFMFNVPQKPYESVIQRTCVILFIHQTKIFITKWLLESKG